MADKPPFVVSEIVTPWSDDPVCNSRPTGVTFQAELNRRAGQGYRLHSWRFARSVNPSNAVDHIIAVFELEAKQ